MTLQELVEQYRPHLVDESVGVRRSWEEMFKYTFKLYSQATQLKDFDLDELAERLAFADLHRALIDGYIKRWRALLNWANGR